MPSVFDVLGHDHQEVKQMLTELEKGPVAGAGAGDSALPVQEDDGTARHRGIQARGRGGDVFLPAVRDRVPDGERLASTATAQEQEGKEVLDRLDKLDADDPEFEQLVAAFIQAGREHISFEEAQVWPLLRAALTTEQADDLGDKLQAAKKTAPTRPHPHTPGSPGVLKTPARRSQRPTGPGMWPAGGANRKPARSGAR